tara:strand:+ start:728 stop:1003 length:276 start_codon:yes stop_codon:yes gene_type:complete
MCVSPRLTGLGTIFFSNEEEMLISAVKFDEFYTSVIILYKGQLETWFVGNATIGIDLKIIYVTVLKIFKCNPSSFRRQGALKSFISSDYYE